MMDGGSPASTFLCHVIRNDSPRFRHVLIIRLTVFVDEQKFSYEEEIDDKDPRCIHFLLVDPRDDSPVGTIRFEPDSSHQLQRLAVLSRYRKTGAGSALVRAFLEYLRQTMQGQSVDICTHAQVLAQSFYIKNGFAPDSEHFIEDGQMHLRMRRTLAHDATPIEGAPQLVVEV